MKDSKDNSTKLIELLLDIEQLEEELKNNLEKENEQ